jgi:hypothetical protein
MKLRCLGVSRSRCGSKVTLYLVAEGAHILGYARTRETWPVVALDICWGEDWVQLGNARSGRLDIAAMVAKHLGGPASCHS